MSTEKYPIIVVPPLTSSAEELVDFFRNDDSCEVIEAPAHEAASLALKRQPCIVVTSISDSAELIKSIEVLKNLNLKLNRSFIKAIVVGKKNFAHITEAMRALFVSDFVLEPVATRTLIFKGKLQLNTIKALAKSTGGSAGKAVLKKSEGGAAPGSGESGEEDVFVFTQKKAKWVKEKLVIDVQGPSPEDGEWEKAGVAPDGMDEWAWKPKKNKPGQPAGKSGWKTKGDKPRFNPETKSWELSAEKPNLRLEGDEKEPAVELVASATGELELKKSPATIAKREARAAVLRTSMGATAAKEKTSPEKRAGPGTSADADPSPDDAPGTAGEEAPEKSPLSPLLKKGEAEPPADVAAGKAEAGEDNVTRAFGAKDDDGREAATTISPASAESRERAPLEKNKPALLPAARTARSSSAARNDALEKARASLAQGLGDSLSDEEIKALEEDVGEVPGEDDDGAPSDAAAGPARKETLRKLAEIKAKRSASKASSVKAVVEPAREPAGKANEKNPPGTPAERMAETERAKKAQAAARGESIRKERLAKLLQDKNVEDLTEAERRELEELTAREPNTTTTPADDAEPPSEKRAREFDAAEDAPIPKKKSAKSTDPLAKLRDKLNAGEETSGETEETADFHDFTGGKEEKENFRSELQTGGDKGKRKINAKDSDVDEADVNWQAKNGPKDTARESRYFYRDKVQISQQPGRWERTDAGYFFLRTSITKNRLQLLQEALPLWFYPGNREPRLSSNQKQWIFLDVEPVLAVSTDVLPKPVLDALRKYLVKKEKGEETESHQSKDLKEFLETRQAGKVRDESVDEETEPGTVEAPADAKKRPAQIIADDEKRAQSARRESSTLEALFGNKPEEAPEDGAADFSGDEESREKRARAPKTSDEELSAPEGDDDRDDGDFIDEEPAAQDAATDVPRTEEEWKNRLKNLANKLKPVALPRENHEEELVVDKKSAATTESAPPPPERRKAKSLAASEEGHEEDASDAQDQERNPSPRKTRASSQTEAPETSKARREVSDGAAAPGAESADKGKKNGASSPETLPGRTAKNREESSNAPALDEKSRERSAKDFSAPPERPAARAASSDGFPTETAGKPAREAAHSPEAEPSARASTEEPTPGDANDLSAEAKPKQPLGADIPSPNTKNLPPPAPEATEAKEPGRKAADGNVTEPATNGEKTAKSVPTDAVTAGDVKPDAANSLDSAQPEAAQNARPAPTHSASPSTTAPAATVAPATANVPVGLPATSSGTFGTVNPGAGPSASAGAAVAAAASPAVAAQFALSLSQLFAKDGTPGTATPAPFSLSHATKPQSSPRSLRIAEAIAQAIHENTARSPERAKANHNDLALELALAQVTNRKLDSTRTAKILRDYCEKRLPRCKTYVLERGLGVFHRVEENGTASAQSVASAHLEHLTAERRGAVRQIATADKTILLWIEFGETASRAVSDDWRVIERIGQDYAFASLGMSQLPGAA